MIPFFNMKNSYSLVIFLHIYIFILGDANVKNILQLTYLIYTYIHLVYLTLRLEINVLVKKNFYNNLSHKNLNLPFKSKI